MSKEAIDPAALIVLKKVKGLASQGEPYHYFHDNSNPIHVSTVSREGKKFMTADGLEIFRYREITRGYDREDGIGVSLDSERIIVRQGEKTVFSATARHDTLHGIPSLVIDEPDSFKVGTFIEGEWAKNL